MVKENNICRNLGRIRSRINMIRGGRDSNLLSTETVLIKISKINLLKMNPRKNIPWGKEEDHQSNVVGVNKIAFTRNSLIEEIKCNTPMMGHKYFLFS
jgi:hypothetical protein